MLNKKFAKRVLIGVLSYLSLMTSSITVSAYTESQFTIGNGPITDNYYSTEKILAGVNDSPVEEHWYFSTPNEDNGYATVGSQSEKWEELSAIPTGAYLSVYCGTTQATLIDREGYIRYQKDITRKYTFNVYVTDVWGEEGLENGEITGDPCVLSCPGHTVETASFSWSSSGGGSFGSGGPPSDTVSCPYCDHPCGVQVTKPYEAEVPEIKDSQGNITQQHKDAVDGTWVREAHTCTGSLSIVYDCSTGTYTVQASGDWGTQTWNPGSSQLVPNTQRYNTVADCNWTYATKNGTVITSSNWGYTNTELIDQGFTKENTYGCVCSNTHNKVHTSTDCYTFELKCYIPIISYVDITQEKAYQSSIWVYEGDSLLADTDINEFVVSTNELLANSNKEFASSEKAARTAVYSVNKKWYDAQQYYPGSGRLVFGTTLVDGIGKYDESCMAYYNSASGTWSNPENVSTYYTIQYGMVALSNNANNFAYASAYGDVRVDVVIPCTRGWYTSFSGSSVDGKVIDGFWYSTRNENGGSIQSDFCNSYDQMGEYRMIGYSNDSSPMSGVESFKATSPYMGHTGWTMNQIRRIISAEPIGGLVSQVNENMDQLTEKLFSPYTYWSGYMASKGLWWLQNGEESVQDNISTDGLSGDTLTETTISGSLLRRGDYAKYAASTARGAVATLQMIIQSNCRGSIDSYVGNTDWFEQILAVRGMSESQLGEYSKSYSASITRTYDLEYGLVDGRATPIELLAATPVCVFSDLANYSCEAANYNASTWNLPLMHDYTTPFDVPFDSNNKISIWADAWLMEDNGFLESTSVGNLDGTWDYKISWDYQYLYYGNLTTSTFTLYRLRGGVASECPYKYIKYSVPTLKGYIGEWQGYDTTLMQYKTTWNPNVGVSGNGNGNVNPYAANPAYSDMTHIKSGFEGVVTLCSFTRPYTGGGCKFQSHRCYGNYKLNDALQANQDWIDSHQTYYVYNATDPWYGNSEEGRDTYEYQEAGAYVFELAGRSYKHYLGRLKTPTDHNAIKGSFIGSILTPDLKLSTDLINKDTTMTLSSEGSVNTMITEDWLDVTFNYIRSNDIYIAGYPTVSVPRTSKILTAESSLYQSYWNDIVGDLVGSMYLDDTEKCNVYTGTCFYVYKWDWDNYPLRQLFNKEIMTNPYTNESYFATNETYSDWYGLYDYILNLTGTNSSGVKASDYYLDKTWEYLLAMYTDYLQGQVSGIHNISDSFGEIDYIMPELLRIATVSDAEDTYISTELRMNSLRISDTTQNGATSMGRVKMFYVTFENFSDGHNGYDKPLSSLPSRDANDLLQYCRYDVDDTEYILNPITVHSPVSTEFCDIVSNDISYTSDFVASLGTEISEGTKLDTRVTNGSYIINNTGTADFLNIGKSFNIFYSDYGYFNKNSYATGGIVDESTAYGITHSNYNVAESINLASIAQSKGFNTPGIWDCGQWTQGRFVKFDFDVMFKERSDKFTNGYGEQQQGSGEWITVAAGTLIDLSRIKDFEADCKKQSTTDVCLTHGNDIDTCRSSGCSHYDESTVTVSGTYYTFFLTTNNDEVNNGKAYFLSRAVNDIGIDDLTKSGSALAKSLYSEYDKSRYYDTDGDKLPNIGVSSYGWTYLKNRLEGSSMSITSYINSQPSKIEPMSSAEVKRAFTNLNQYDMDGKLRQASTWAVTVKDVDIIGIINNVTIEDTGDFRFSNLFKQVNANGWLIPGLVRSVDLSRPNKVATDYRNIVGQTIPTLTDIVGETFFYDSYFGNTYQKDASTNSVVAKSGPNVSLPLTAWSNNIPELRREQLKIGYAIYADIETLGNYYGVDGQSLTLTPHYYLLDTEDSSLQEVDIYYMEGENYVPAYRTNGSVDTDYFSAYEYLVWGEEKKRRNTTDAIDSATDIICSVMGWGQPDDYESFVLSTDKETQTLTEGARDFIGSSVVNGGNNGTKSDDNSSTLYQKQVDRDSTGDTVSGYNSDTTLNTSSNEWSTRSDGTIKSQSELKYAMQSQRYSFKLSLPTSSILLPVSSTVYTDTATIKALNEQLLSSVKSPVLLVTIEVIADGQVWELEYQAPSVSEMILQSTEEDPSTPESSIPLPDLPNAETPIAIYDADTIGGTASDDYTVTGTH